MVKSSDLAPEGLDDGWLWEHLRSKPNPSNSLMSIKVIRNEFLAYIGLANLLPDAPDTRTRMIKTYTLYG